MRSADGTSKLRIVGVLDFAEDQKPSNACLPSHTSAALGNPDFHYNKDADPKQTLLHLAAAVFYRCKKTGMQWEDTQLLRENLETSQIRVSAHDADLAVILPEPEAHVCSPLDLLKILKKFFANTFSVDEGNSELP